MVTSPFTLRVNAGETRERYIDAAGHAWDPDHLYTEGATYGFFSGATISHDPALTIADSDNPTLYRSERYGLRRFLAHVPEGRYLVRLHFCEVYGAYRLFSVAIQGKRVLEDLFIEKAAGGTQIALIKEFPHVTARDGKLDIVFIPKEHTSPEINGIEIIAEYRGR